MVIGIVGPKVSCKKIRDDLIYINPSLSIRTYVREKPTDAIEVVEQSERECDATIFTGEGVYNAVKMQYECKKTFGVITKSDTSISSVFYEMQKQGYEIENFSLDGTDTKIIKDILSELNINPKNIYLYQYENYDEQKCVDWHINLFNAKKINVALTGLVHIYDYLKSLNYPVFYLPITRSSVRVCYENLINKYALNEAQYSQIAVEILKITNFSENAENYYSKMLKKNDAERLIIEYVQKIQGSINHARNEYIIFTSKGCVQTNNNYSLLHELQKKIDSIGLTLNIGIGCGATAYASESNAQKALARSVKSKGGEAFLIDESDTLIGPLYGDKQMQYSLISPDENIIGISKKLDLSCESVLKILSIIDVRKSNVFDAIELADCLNISIRSARRILSKILFSGLGKIYAKESSSKGGRPKNLIEINF